MRPKPVEANDEVEREPYGIAATALLAFVVAILLVVYALWWITGPDVSPLRLSPEPCNCARPA